MHTRLYEMESSYKDLKYAVRLDLVPGQVLNAPEVTKCYQIYSLIRVLCSIYLPSIWGVDETDVREWRSKSNSKGQALFCPHNAQIYFSLCISSFFNIRPKSVPEHIYIYKRAAHICIVDFGRTCNSLNFFISYECLWLHDFLELFLFLKRRSEYVLSYRLYNLHKDCEARTSIWFIWSY